MVILAVSVTGLVSTIVAVNVILLTQDSNVKTCNTTSLASTMISPTSTSTSTTAQLNPRCNTTSNIHPEDLVAVVLGGFNHNNQRLSDVEVIPASYVCSPLPDMPSAVTDAASVYIPGSKTIIIWSNKYIF